MGGLRFEICGEFDNVDGLEWALFGADTTTNAECF